MVLAATYASYASYASYLYLPMKWEHLAAK